MDALKSCSINFADILTSKVLDNAVKSAEEYIGKEDKVEVKSTEVDQQVASTIIASLLSKPKMQPNLRKVRNAYDI
jgi:diphthamide biosynthesis methyltransferase